MILLILIAAAIAESSPSFLADEALESSLGRKAEMIPAICCKLSSAAFCSFFCFFSHSLTCFLTADETLRSRFLFNHFFWLLFFLNVTFFLGVSDVSRSGRRRIISAR